MSDLRQTDLLCVNQCKSMTIEDQWQMNINGNLCRFKRMQDGRICFNSWKSTASWMLPHLMHLHWFCPHNFDLWVFCLRPSWDRIHAVCSVMKRAVSRFVCHQERGRCAVHCTIWCFSSPYKIASGTDFGYKNDPQSIKDRSKNRTRFLVAFKIASRMMLDRCWEWIQRRMQGEQLRTAREVQSWRTRKGRNSHWNMKYTLLAPDLWGRQSSLPKNWLCVRTSWWQ